MSGHRKLVWDSLLDADMNARYWGHLARRYQRREMRTKIFLAITSSGAVAGWTLWSRWPQVWHVLSGVSMVVAVALPVLNYSQIIEGVSELRAK
jgi:hypothetical protein